MVRMSTVCVREGRLPNGMKTVVVENDLVAVTVLPDKGADIYSVEYKPKQNLNVLFRSPWEPRIPGASPFAGTPEEQWMDSYHGGWQFMFPNAGSDCRYKGATQGYHGEASVIPWSYRTHCDERKASVTCSAHLTRTPYAVKKTISLTDGEATVRIHDTITNLGEEDIDYIWGQHIAFGAPFLSGRCKLEIPNEETIIEASSHGPEDRLPIGKAGWPNVRSVNGSMVDLRAIPSTDSRAGDMMYLTGMKEGWYIIRNEESGVSAKVSWDLQAYPYVWLWREFRGTFGYPFHGRCYVMGVEPCSTPISTGLADSVAQGYAFKLGPGQSRETEISLKLSAE